MMAYLSVGMHAQWSHRSIVQTAARQKWTQISTPCQQRRNRKQTQMLSRQLRPLLPRRRQTQSQR